jgi:DNA-binding MarR family transcriptional regulator
MKNRKEFEKSFVEICVEAKNDYGLSDNQARIYGTVYAYNERGMAFDMSYTELAVMMGLKEKTVKEHIRSMVKRKILNHEVIKKGGLEQHIFYIH